LNRSKKLASQIAFALSFAMLFTASAFADNRPSRETRGRDRVRSQERRSSERSFDRSQRETRSVDASRNNNNRSFDRGRNNDRRNDRNNDRSFDRGQSRSSESFRNESRRNDSFRNDSYRNDSYRRSAPSYRSHDYRGSRQPYYAHGRVSRYERYGGGYRVWLGGVPYPFFIPEARFRLFPRFSVGLDIRLGGYYNPRGYYDYYDGSSYTSGGLRGRVESVDLRRGRLIVYDDVSNAFVTVEMRDYERRLDDVRIGDYIELSGDWTRIGTFVAYRLDALDPQGGFYR